MIYKIICKNKKELNKLENDINDLEDKGFELSNFSSASDGDEAAFTPLLCAIMRKSQVS